MSQSTFDRKFGEDFLKSVPLEPGVYQFFEKNGDLNYIGKAKSLRVRLRQYRNASRKRKDHKLRTIVQLSDLIEFEQCSSEKDALLLENKLIQKLRPPLNVVGAFSFLYPCVGFKVINKHTISLAYTTLPGELENYSLYGAFRSRESVKDFFESLCELLPYVGHKEKCNEKVPYSKIRSFRQVPEALIQALPSLLLGESREFLEVVGVSLLDHSAACANAGEVQVALKILARFFKNEAQALYQARTRVGVKTLFIPQEDRDALFIESKAL